MRIRQKELRVARKREEERLREQAHGGRKVPVTPAPPVRSRPRKKPGTPAE